MTPRQVPTGPQSFSWQGRELRWFAHLYNLTWLNERAIEIPIAFDFVDRHAIDGHAGLSSGMEVGNVLGHYRECGHVVVDLTEPAAWYQRGQIVLNSDVLDVHGSWPWIVAVSTLEHIGVDTDPDVGAERAVTALEHLRRSLLPDGELLVTFGMGQNPALDEFVCQLGDDTDALRWSVYQRDADTGVWWEHPFARLDAGEIQPYGSIDSWAATVFVGVFPPLAVNPRMS